MSTLVIEGGHKLSGSVDVEGNKNSALPLIAACLLTTEECVLSNVPRISAGSGSSAAWWVLLATVVVGLAYAGLLHHVRQVAAEREFAALPSRKKELLEQEILAGATTVVQRLGE